MEKEIIKPETNPLKSIFASAALWRCGISGDSAFKGG